MKRIGLSDSCRIAASTLSLSVAGAGIHQQHAVVAHLHGDVAAGAGEHVDVALHRQHLDVAGGSGRLRRGLAARGSLATRLRGSPVARLQRQHVLRIESSRAAPRALRRHAVLGQELLRCAAFMPGRWCGT